MSASSPSNWNASRPPPMRASHKKRIARLMASLPSPDEAERREVEGRVSLRFDAKLCAVIRAAMLRRGIDPAGATALREWEARVAGFLDSPELQAADEAFRGAHPEDEAEEETGREDRREELTGGLTRIAQPFRDRSSPASARS